MGTLVMLLVGVLIVAVVVWIVGMMSIDAKAKQIIQVVAAIALVLWMLAVVFGWGPALEIRG